MSDGGIPGFDLVDGPWLPCLMTDGGTRELGLRDVLLDAHLVRELSLEVPTQFPPVLRLLLAIVHRALRQPGTSGGPRGEEAWRHLWELGSLPRGPLSQYLDTHRDRFQLFHPAAPFLQVAGLKAASGAAKTIAQLIPFAAKGNNAPLFSAARDDDPPSLTCAEAARWLLHAHAWDTAAIKTGAVGDSHVKAGKTFGNPTGPLGQLGVLIPAGRTLWRTLLFNLLVLGDDISPAGDAPVWEAGPLTAQWQERHPRGVLDLYTWPGRRVRLVSEQTASGVRVRRAVLAAGGRIADITTLTRVEPHTAWQRSESQEKKLKRARTAIAVGVAAGGWPPAHHERDTQRHGSQRVSGVMQRVTQQRNRTRDRDHRRLQRRRAGEHGQGDPQRPDALSAGLHRRIHRVGCIVGMRAQHMPKPPAHCWPAGMNMAVGMIPGRGQSADRS